VKAGWRWHGWAQAPGQPVPVVQTADEKAKKVIHVVEGGKVKTLAIVNPIGFKPQGGA
jgi:hypothetical protein